MLGEVDIVIANEEDIHMALGIEAASMFTPVVIARGFHASLIYRNFPRHGFGAVVWKIIFPSRKTKMS